MRAMTYASFGDPGVLRLEEVATPEPGPGDEVYGDLSACGFGAFAEAGTAPEDALARKPANLSFPEAAAVPMAGVVALQALRDAGRLQAGERVLIVGASGGNGTFAVQLARGFGADVTAVCSARNAAWVRSLGADRTIDYAEEDSAAEGPRWDLILAMAGYRSILDYRRALAAGGRCRPGRTATTWRS